VPEGGIFDGPLGVYAGLEAVRAMRDAGAAPARPVTVVSFTEEEGGRFASGLLGSSVATGERDVEEALALTDDGETLESALDAVDYRGEGRLDASAWDAWLELHVEQSSRLEDAGVPVGVVTTVTGITHCEAAVVGAANHAGTTPMADRTDALAAASEVVLDVEAAARDEGAESGTAVGTVGSLSVSPDAANVVPGRVELSVDVRDVGADVMERLVARAEDSLERVASDRGVETEFSRPFHVDPTPMSDRLRTALHDAAGRTGVETLDLHSGAFHDTTYVARVIDAAMLFAPSRDGVSHSPREWTDWEDCATAARVLADAVASLSGATRDGAASD
jgi:N-carbamoyl-L-amino-acid hydrolase